MEVGEGGYYLPELGGPGGFKWIYKGKWRL